MKNNNSIFVLSANPVTGFIKQMADCFTHHGSIVVCNTLYEEETVQRKRLTAAGLVVCILDEYSTGGGTYEKLISAAVYHRCPLIFVYKNNYRLIPRLEMYARNAVAVIRADSITEIVQSVLKQQQCAAKANARSTEQVQAGESSRYSRNAAFSFSFQTSEAVSGRNRGTRPAESGVTRTESSYERAVKMMAADRKSAFASLLRLAQAGDVRAILLVAAEYEHGGVFKQDAAQAEYWYQQGMKTSDADAVYEYGLFCFRNGDYDNAEVALRYAAESLKHMQSVRMLIKWYTEAYEIPGKDAEIDPLLERLIAVGDTKAMIMRGKRLLARKSRSEETAGMEYLRRAARTDLDAHMEIAKYYIAKREYGRAEPSLRLAAESRNHEAEYLIGCWYFSGKECYHRDYSKAVLWLRRAAATVPEAAQLLQDRALKGYY